MLLTAGTVTLGPATLYRSLQRMRVDGLVEEIATEDVEALRADRRAGSPNWWTRPRNWEC